MIDNYKNTTKSNSKHWEILFLMKWNLLNFTIPQWIKLVFTKFLSLNQKWQQHLLHLEIFFLHRLILSTWKHAASPLQLSPDLPTPAVKISLKELWLHGPTYCERLCVYKEHIKLIVWETLRIKIFPIIIIIIL